ncbi:3D domain-containing protein [Alkalicoccus daliensis]|uniref:3D (Asp-Asp-Asp) domain-containing protein n=1 Tax=Alkalicoccus daliensis TaxID=745820 RepID=A0A1H0KTP9_9BACI|nr:3D (Asp-Asp-Asp) domain-containing protein [Alkalicoccus daliensis]
MFRRMKEAFAQRQKSFLVSSAGMVLVVGLLGVVVYDTAGNEDSTDDEPVLLVSLEDTGITSGENNALNGENAPEAAPVNTETADNTAEETNTEESPEAGEWESFTATAYTASCEGCSGVTRTGIDLEENPDANVVAVDPDVIPLGSTVEVRGHGEFLAADTGGAINGQKIDIFMPERENALSFGRQEVEVRVID